MQHVVFAQKTSASWRMLAVFCPRIAHIAQVWLVSFYFLSIMFNHKVTVLLAGQLYKTALSFMLHFILLGFVSVSTCLCS